MESCPRRSLIIGILTRGVLVPLNLNGLITSSLRWRADHLLCSGHLSYQDTLALLAECINLAQGL